eukprot:9498040-Pyramimonas_sp.AAC.1
MEEDEPLPTAGSAPTVEQAMAGQLRQVSAQGSEPQAEPRPASSEDPPPTAHDTPIPDQDEDPDLHPQPAAAPAQAESEGQEADGDSSASRLITPTPMTTVTDSAARFREMRRNLDAAEMAPMRTFSAQRDRQEHRSGPYDKVEFSED